MQLLGKLQIVGDGIAQVRDDRGVVLAEGALWCHPGSQSIVEMTGDVASAVQFSGKLTDAGREALAAGTPIPGEQPAPGGDAA